ncbi:hypothetical protein ACQPYK_42285 [Streptosporangium sp. CA-135522]|uniref:hypothetical protein n=1 Tax=Streptosporangium sp. CA-135522 TaxID=3240072 RepID=UPI003D8A6DAC
MGVFGVLWFGVAAFAAFDASTWSRAGQSAFGVFLVGWALHKANLLLRPAERRITTRRRRIGA